MDYAEISVAGTTRKLPAANVNGRTIIVTGSWLKLAAIKDEDWQDGEIVSPPERFLAEFRQYKGLPADIFSFSRRLGGSDFQYPFYYEWDSVAAIPGVSFADWWTNRVSSDLRKDVRRAEKRGVVVREVPFDDDLVRGIVEIYDETPIRQGGPFWHYKKGFAAVKSTHVTYLEQSMFIGAFCGEELVGFIKVVFVDHLGRIMQIISKDAHRDKRPTNALIAKAVELCETRGCSYLTYGRYEYSQGADSLTAFKHRNGFQEYLVPRYHVPLTTKGRLAIGLRLHRDPRTFVPRPILRSLKRAKTLAYSQLQPNQKAT